MRKAFLAFATLSVLAMVVLYLNFRHLNLKTTQTPHSTSIQRTPPPPPPPRPTTIKMTLQQSTPLPIQKSTPFLPSPPSLLPPPPSNPLPSIAKQKNEIAISTQPSQPTKPLAVVAIATPDTTAAAPTTTVSTSSSPTKSNSNYKLCGAKFQWPQLTAREKTLKNACKGASFSGDIPGGDLMTVDLPVMKDFDDLLTRCCATCNQQPNCKGFTMLHRTCWLKRNVASTKTTSGISNSNSLTSAKMTNVLKFRRRSLLEASAVNDAAGGGLRPSSTTPPTTPPPTTTPPTIPPVAACLHGRYNPPGATTSKSSTRSDLEPSCDAVCRSMGKICTEKKNIVTSFLNNQNSCTQLIQQFPCRECETGWGSDLPAFRVWNYNFGKGKMGKCFSRSLTNPNPFFCSGSFANSHRLCPCIEKEKMSVTNELENYFCEHESIDSIHVRGGSVRIRSYLRYKSQEGTIKKLSTTNINAMDTKARASIKCQYTHLPFLFDTIGK